MTSPFKSRALLAAAVLLPLQFCIGQVPTNGTIIAFGPPLMPVWDITSTYWITNQLQGAGIQPLAVVFQDIGIGVDAHGHVYGAGTMVVDVGSDQVAGDYKVSGKVSGGGAATKVNFSVHCKGQGIIAGVNTSYNLSANYKLVVNPAGTNMVGTTTGNAHFSHLGGGSLKSAISVPLPAGVDGYWNVTLDIYPFGNKISGTAVVAVDNAPTIPPNPSTRTLATKANGSVPKQSLTAKVKLSGYGNSAGTQLNLTLTPALGTTNVVTTVKGKVLGQNVRS